MAFKNTYIQKNIIANFFKILVLFSNQILLVPAYIHYLGVELYGDWIVISAISSFFTMSDVGVSSVSNNMFSISYNRDEICECNKILYNNLIFTCSILLLGIICILIAGPFVNFKTILNLHCISNSEAIIICALLVFQILLIMGGNVFDSVYNAVHLAHKATYINHIARLFNAILIFVGLFLKLSLIWIVAISVIPYIIIDLYKIRQARYIFKYEFSSKLLDIEYLRSIIKPAIGFMFFPAGNAILFQGITLIVNYYLGAVSLVLFNTSRTMTNFIRNIVQAISAGIKPEFSISYAHKDIESMKQLYRKSITYSLLLAIMAIIALLIGGNFVYTIWTRNEIKYDALLVMILCGTLLINSIWEASCITMTSTNRHFRFSMIYVIATIVTIVIAYFVVRIFLTIYAAAATLAIVDIVMAYMAISFSKKLIAKV